MWSVLVTEKRSDLERDTAGGHHRLIDPADAECSEKIRAQERCHRKAKARAKDTVGESNLRRSFPIRDVCRGDPDDGKYHINVPLGWTVLDGGAAKSLAGAESAAMLAEACEKRGRKAGDDRKAEAVNTVFVESESGWSRHSSSCWCLEFSEDQMCIAHRSSLSAAGYFSVGNDRLLPWSFSFHLYLVDC